MFNSLKKTLGYLPDSSNVIASFSFSGNYEVIDNKAIIKNSVPFRTSLVHNIFRLGEELEIHFHEKSTKTDYFLAKRPYLNTTGDTVYEVVDKKHKGKLIMILESQKRSLQIMTVDNSAPPIIFSTVNLDKQIEDKVGLINAIHVNFAKWAIINKLELETCTNIQEFSMVWQILMENEVPFFASQFKCNLSFVRTAIREYRLDFLTKADINLNLIWKARKKN